MVLYIIKISFLHDMMRQRLSTILLAKTKPRIWDLMVARLRESVMLILKAMLPAIMMLVMVITIIMSKNLR